MKNSTFAFFITILTVIFGCSSSDIATKFSHRQPLRPQVFSSDSVLLPTGSYLTPAGMSVRVGDFPMNIALSPSRSHAVVVNSGYGQQTLSIVNIKKRSIVYSLNIKGSWYGAKWSPLGDYFFVSGANDNRIYRYGFEKDSAWFINSIYLGKPAPEEYISPAGLDVNNEGSEIYVVTRMNNTVYKLNAYDNTISASVSFGFPLYTCVLDEKRKLLYVSVWGDAHIAVIDIQRMEVKNRISVGDHPSEMVMNSNGSYLFVANSNDKTVSIIDLHSHTVERTIDVRPMIGSTPNSVALSDDGKTLFVANADANEIAVIDIAQKQSTVVKGYIPTGWYPTSVRVVDSLLLVANGKGNSSLPNRSNENIAELMQGTISFIPIPDSERLTKYSDQVLRNNRRVIQIPSDSITWMKNIKHVFYIIKENRTYDDILGDIKSGKGDSTLTRFGYDVTPNHHALAEEFVLFDNFYSAGEVGADGMNWLTAAYANDYIEKTWPTLYGRRGGEYDYEKDGMASPLNGYLWDAALTKGLRVRNYGMFLDEDASERSEIIPLVRGLHNNTSPIYRGWDLQYYDTSRAASWMKEFTTYEQGDSLPHLTMIRLPNDHTAGRSSRFRSQRAFVADNDLALGTIVERITKSKYWKESAIFVVENNAQGGSDHVDAHRTIALVVSPYTKRKFVDHTLYSTLSVVRTIEEILYLSPMTLHDANALLMYNAFQSTPDYTPFTVRKNIINL